MAYNERKVMTYESAPANHAQASWLTSHFLFRRKQILTTPKEVIFMKPRNERRGPRGGLGV